MNRRSLECPSFKSDLASVNMVGSDGTPHAVHVTSPSYDMSGVSSTWRIHVSEEIANFKMQGFF
ncbi:MAG TPA: hypothetical protein VGO47_08915 [Chlamydiales bacterium]|nr:hypothetical protein [Chlamydiales bacterium]